MTDTTKAIIFYVVFAAIVGCVAWAKENPYIEDAMAALNETICPSRDQFGLMENHIYILHCWHSDGNAYLSNPPQYRDLCCYCGKVRWRASNSLYIDYQKHGDALRGYHE